MPASGEWLPASGEWGPRIDELQALTLTERVRTSRRRRSVFIGLFSGFGFGSDLK